MKDSDVCHFRFFFLKHTGADGAEEFFLKDQRAEGSQPQNMRVSHLRIPNLCNACPSVLGDCQGYINFHSYNEAW